MKWSLIITIVLGLMVPCKSKDMLFKDVNMPLDERVEDLLSRLTLEEKVSLTHANSKFTVTPIERLGIPALALSDGPHGVRQEIQPHSWEPMNWTTDSATYLPTGTALAATWNPELAKTFGEVLGAEARARNKDIILGPGINLMRTPLNGRNFEYMGEDPHLIIKMAVPLIKGIQSQDVAACLKHYALNNQEHNRFGINVEVDERTLHEFYLPGYEAAVKEGEVFSVMGAYNKFRGHFCCSSNYLINDILKERWGFKGLVMSDWDATQSTVESAMGGLDLEMGTVVDRYEDFYFADSLLKAVKKGTVPESILDDKVRRILYVMFKTNIFDKRKKGAMNTPEHQEIAKKIAQEAVVLLKNKDEFLPLNKKNIKSIAVIGDNAVRKHAGGGGSSGVKALYEITPLKGLENYLGDDVKLNFAQGYKRTTQFSWENGVTDKPLSKSEKNALIKESVVAAKKSDMVLYFGGLNHDFDTEAADRKNMRLPYHQTELLNEILKVNPNVVVLLISGAPLEMDPWDKKVPAIVQAWYAGMEAGNVFASVLFGNVNPSGKLPFTFPKKLADSPAHKMGNYPGTMKKLNYEEGIFVGYRFFDQNNIEPLYPFGFGLSYTTFELNNLSLDKKTISKDENLSLTLNLKNTGPRSGAEVVQLYVRDVNATVERPLRELKAFKKVHLKPGAAAVVNFEISQKDLSFYDTESASWQCEAGEFEVVVGTSSRNLPLKQKFVLKAN